jgi:decaprenylphospho-beta-D-erythro-pentofuranosid-2-ulose 2-reductase
MNNAVGEPQNIVLLGGRSEIGLAIVRHLVSPNTKTVVLAGRPGKDTGSQGTASGDEATSAPLGPGSYVTIKKNFDACEVSSHQAFISQVAKEIGDLDVVVVAFGVLGDQAAFDAQPPLAAELAMVNFGGAMSICLAAAEQFRKQGHGHLVVLSSVAGERVRKANFVYGATKAALDAFAQGLSDALVEHSVAVTIVRPGYVHTAMTAGLPPAPFATTADEVAKATVKGMRSGRRIVWAPGILRWVFMVLRHLPTFIWRRLPLG